MEENEEIQREVDQVKWALDRHTGKGVHRWPWRMVSSAYWDWRAEAALEECGVRCDQEED